MIFFLICKIALQQVVQAGRLPSEGPVFYVICSNIIFYTTEPYFLILRYECVCFF